MYGKIQNIRNRDCVFCQSTEIILDTSEVESIEVSRLPAHALLVFKQTKLHTYDLRRIATSSKYKKM